MNTTTTTTTLAPTAKRGPGRPRLHPLPDPNAIKGKPGRKPEFVNKAAWQRAWRAKMIADGYKEVHRWVKVDPTEPAAGLQSKLIAIGQRNGKAGPRHLVSFLQDAWTRYAELSLDDDDHWGFVLECHNPRKFQELAFACGVKLPELQPPPAAA